MSPRDLVTASDGFPARRIQAWTHEKLYYIDRYLDIFSTAMKGKWDLVYADMLAGPGVCVDEETGEEVPGSPLLAVNRAPFCRLFLNDLDSRCAEALRARTASQPAGRVVVSNKDCNEAVEVGRHFLFPTGSEAHTLGVALIDPTAYQFTFESLRRLTDGLRLDLIIVFMTDFARRFIGTEAFERPLDGFFGTPRWRDLVTRPIRRGRTTYRDLLDLYERQLRAIGYRHVNDDGRIRGKVGGTLYHIVFASKHERGKEFFEKISRKLYSGQRRLL